MFDLYALCPFMVAIVVVTWTPDQWISLIRTVEIPGLCSIAIVAWRSKVSDLLDALIMLLKRSSIKLEAFGVKGEATKPEEVASMADTKIAFRLTPVSDQTIHLPITVPEQYARFSVVKSERKSAIKLERESTIEDPIDEAAKE